ncbi:MAG TPA: hypothetical protein DCE43_20600 [Planctomycetaceae bacterium]|nr:hypothetical protein [Planctomycetaceae bacterium]HCK51593.1 hypothetical protein [Planctomycetaceae bacterium]
MSFEPTSGVGLNLARKGGHGFLWIFLDSVDLQEKPTPASIRCRLNKEVAQAVSGDSSISDSRRQK